MSDKRIYQSESNDKQDFNEANQDIFNTNNIFDDMSICFHDDHTQLALNKFDEERDKSDKNENTFVPPQITPPSNNESEEKIDLE